PPILREEAVAGVNGVRARLPGGPDDALDGEIALAGRRRTDVERVIGGPHVRRPRIRVRVHGDRVDPELPAGPDDPQRDLATIGDQHPVEEAQPSPGLWVGRSAPAGPPSVRVTSASRMRQLPPASATHRAWTTKVVGPTNLVLKMWCAPIRAWATSSNPVNGCIRSHPTRSGGLISASD